MEPTAALVPGAAVGVAQHHVDAAERDTEFLGHHLRLGGHRTPAHIDLSREDRDATVRADHEVGVEVFRIEALRILRYQRGGAHGHQDRHATAYAFAESSPIESVGDGHVEASGIFDAASMASTMRWCAPHRNRLRAMWDSIAARDGFGLSLRNTEAVISMPDVQ
jgi:hypothetical protein